MLRSIYITLILLVFISFNNFLFSQEKKPISKSNNTIYIEGATEIVHYSLNYDRIFSHNKSLNWSFRIGFSLTEDIIALPFGINFLTGNNNSHAEFSLNIVPFIEKYQKIAGKNDLSDKKAVIAPSVGYRYQKPIGGIFFKITAQPTLYLDPPSNDFWNMDVKFLTSLTCAIGFSF